MDSDNLAAVQRLAPASERHRARMFLAADLPDPYYGGPEDFEEVLDLAEAGLRALFVAIAAEGAAARSGR